MKGQIVPLLWTFVLLAILYATHPMWSWSINSIVTSAGGDQLTGLLVQLVFVLLVFAIIAAVWIFRGPKENYYSW